MQSQFLEFFFSFLNKICLIKKYSAINWYNVAHDYRKYKFFLFIQQKKSFNIFPSIFLLMHNTFSVLLSSLVSNVRVIHLFFFVFYSFYMQRSDSTKTCTYVCTKKKRVKANVCSLLLKFEFFQQVGHLWSNFNTFCFARIGYVDKFNENN